MEGHRGYTTIEQSKLLAEILPLESADMKILPFTEREYRIVPINDISVCGREDEIYAWSLAALLGILPRYELNNFGDTIQLDVKLESLATEGNETLLDLVVNMIIHLHELKML